MHTSAFPDELKHYCEKLASLRVMGAKMRPPETPPTSKTMWIRGVQMGVGALNSVPIMPRNARPPDNWSYFFPAAIPGSRCTEPLPSPAGTFVIGDIREAQSF